MEPQQLEVSDSDKPSIPAPPDAGQFNDSRARAEQAFVNSKAESPTNWSERARGNQFRRDEALRSCFFYGIAALIVIVVLLLASALIVWVWHLVGPPQLRWLTESEIEKLQVLVFSGAASSLATVIGRRVLDERPRRDG